MALIKIATRALSHQEIKKGFGFIEFMKRSTENQFLHSILPWGTILPAKTGDKIIYPLFTVMLKLKKYFGSLFCFVQNA